MFLEKLSIMRWPTLAKRPPDEDSLSTSTVVLPLISINLTWDSPRTKPDGLTLLEVVKRVPGCQEAARRHRVSALAHVPNHRLHDLLFDDDVYHGVEIGRITVKP